VDGVDYQCVYQDYRDGQWTPIQDPLDPLVQYAAFGKPMTAQQLDRMQKQQVVPPSQMQTQ
jgi:hypothetical protein